MFSVSDRAILLQYTSFADLMEIYMRTGSQKLTIPAERAKGLHFEFDADVLQHLACRINSPIALQWGTLHLKTRTLNTTRKFLKEGQCCKSCVFFWSLIQSPLDQAKTVKKEA